MSEPKYEVVTRGIIDGEKVEEVRARLRKLIKNKQVSLDPIIDKAELVVKRDLDLQTAKKYRDGFHRAGVICELRRQDETLEAMVCPNCGFRQPKAEACIRCGIIVDKYQEDRRQLEVNESEEKEVRHGGTEAVGGLISKLQKIWSLKGGPPAIIVILVLAAYGIFETIWLRGDLVAHERITITGPNNFVAFKVEKASHKYFISIRTRKKRKLSIKLVDSQGRVHYEDNEYASHKTRSFTFEPPVPGTYCVYVKSGPLSFTTFSKASISIYVNDRRLLTRVLDTLKL